MFRRQSTLPVIPALLAAGFALCVSLSALAADPPREVRGVWLDKAELFEPPAQLHARLDRLAAAGFNTLYVATQVRGTVAYPDSAILPQYAPAKDFPADYLTQVIQAAHERGLRVEAWTEFGFYAYWTRDASTDASRGAVLDRHPELAALDTNGSALIHNPAYGDFYALCPANPAAQQVLIELYRETMTGYPFDGLHLDRVRFPEASFCHCAHCREHFQRDTGLELAAASAADAPLADRQRLDAWRKQQTGAFVERMARVMRAEFPGRTLTSAVVPPSMIDGKGQDWPVWVERGWVDGVAVMLYAAHIDEPLAWIHRRLPTGAPVYIGVDAAGGSERLQRQITQARSGGFPGVAVWYSASVDPLLKALSESVFAPNAAARSSASADTTSNGQAPAEYPDAFP